MADHMILYIDPGTGGMLFTVMFAVFGVLFFSLHALFDKMKFRLSGGKTAKMSGEKYPLVIFSDHKRYWNVFKPIADELEARHQKAVYLTCSEDDPALKAKYEYITAEFIGDFLPAYRFFKRQIRWSGIPISFRIFHSLL